MAILLGVPIGILTGVFLAEVAPKKIAAIVKPAVELLAGIPSVIYGLLGVMILNPVMYRLELVLFKDSVSCSVLSMNLYNNLLFIFTLGTDIKCFIFLCLLWH